MEIYPGCYQGCYQNAEAGPFAGGAAAEAGDQQTAGGNGDAGALWGGEVEDHGFSIPVAVNEAPSSEDLRLRRRRDRPEAMTLSAPGSFSAYAPTASGCRADHKGRPAN